MKNTATGIILLLSAVILPSCEKTILEMPANSNKDVFEAFWKGIDERYAYFELKNINWDSLYNHYGALITDEMNDEALFDTLSVMIDLLQDGHSGIKSPFDIHKNHSFYLRGPENVNERLIVDHYACGQFMQKGALRHFTLADGQIAYIYYGDFSDPVSDDDMDYLIKKYKDTKGIIFDVRNNTGGAADNIFTIVKRFINTKTILFKTRYKNGPGHHDFTGFTNTIIEPEGEYYSGKLCVLTNRKVFSAGSVFTLSMKEVPHAIIVGDTTGGGLGLPVGFELPNEWQVHCAGTQIISVNGDNYEMGIPPDVQIDLKKEDEEQGIDSIIEKAMEIILK